MTFLTFVDLHGSTKLKHNFLQICFSAIDRYICYIFTSLTKKSLFFFIDVDLATVLITWNFISLPLQQCFFLIK